MTRVLVTGAGGMLGWAVVPAFRGLGADVYATDRTPADGVERLDVRDAAAVRLAVALYRPDVVVNLAAETDLEFCETDVRAAYATNCYGAGVVADECARSGARLVHVSTVGVFDGAKASYAEGDDPDPVNVYGRSKLAGEQLVRSCPGTLVVRSGWMMGGGPGRDKKFVGKVVGQVAAGAAFVYGVADSFGTPTCARSLASAIAALACTGAGAGETVHAACGGACSRYDVAREVVSALGREKTVGVVPVSSGFFPEYWVRRPVHESLGTEKLRSLGVTMPDWRTAVREYVRREWPGEVVGL